MEKKEKKMCGKSIEKGHDLNRNLLPLTELGYC